MGQRAGVDAARHQPRKVRHVDEQIRAHLVSDGAEPLEIDEAWIGRAARYDHPGLVLQRHRLKRVIVYKVAVLGYYIFPGRAEVKTSEHQSPIRISYSVYCLNKKRLN